MPRVVLGFNAHIHDTAAALLIDGRLAAFAEEERFRRVKHWAGFPTQAIAYCLKEGGFSISDLDHVAVNQDGRANLVRKLGYLFSKYPSLNLVLDRYRNRRARKGVTELLAESFPHERFSGDLHHIEHHLAHLSSAFHVSPFEDAVVISVDGFGD